MADAVTYETVIIADDRLLPDALIWRRYKYPAPGATEMFLDINPHLRHALAQSPYLPVGVSVLIPVIASIVQRRPTEGKTVRPFGEVD
jgi:phage tail protein X